MSDPTDMPAEIERLRLRLDEQGALIRRSHIAVTTLAESVGQVVATQRRRERGINLNSFIAYLLFTVLLGGGFFALYQARSGELVAARDHALAERDEHRDRADALAAEVAARDQASEQALGFYELLRQDRLAEAIGRFAEIQQSKLTPVERAVFTEGELAARAQIADAGYLAGLEAFRSRDDERATTELERALAYEPEGPRAAQMRYYLGVAAVRLGRHQDGAHHLELAIAGRVDQAGITDARFYLATALEALGRTGEARAEYEKFATSAPPSQLTYNARRKAAMLARPRPPVTTN